MPIFDQAQADAIAATFHKDTISIYPSMTANKGTVGPDFKVTYATPIARYENVAAHIEPLVSRQQRELGGADIVSEEISVKCAAHSVPEVRVGDRIQVTASEDPMLLGESMTIVRVEMRTGALTRRLVCKKHKAGQTPGSS